MKISKKILFPILILIIVFISYGQTSQMYFWQDDSALIFKLQHQQEPAGSYGAGIIGEGAYKYLVTPFVLFFPLFRMNPVGYFMIGILAYIIATGAFYLFSTEVFQNKKAGYFSTLIFAAGYIGSDTMFRISNSWQTNFGLILALLSFWLYLKCIRNGIKLRYYFLSLSFFLIATEFVYIRSHSLIFPILAIDVLVTMITFKWSKVTGLILRQIPFWVIFYNWYLRGGTTGSTGLTSIVEQLIKGKIEILASLFATTGNALVPNTLQNNFTVFFQPREGLALLALFVILSWFLLPLFDAGKKLKIISTLLIFAAFFLNRLVVSKELFWYRTDKDIFSGGLGLYLLAFFFVISLALWKRQKNMAAAVLLGLILVTSQIFGYFIQYPQAIFATTHRYLSHSFVGYSLIIGALCFVLFQRTREIKVSKYRNVLGVAPLLLVLGVNLALGVKYQREILLDRSQPTRAFYEALKKFVPDIKKGSAFYFDISSDSFYQKQFNDFFSVGSMPNQTALAIYYGVDRYDIKLTTNPDELLSDLVTNKIEIDDTYSFFYSKNGLVDTSVLTRQLLNKGTFPKKLTLVSDKNNIVELKTNDISPLTPLDLQLNLSVTADYNNVKYNNDTVALDEKQQYIDYLFSRRHYYERVSAKSLSEWKYQEVGNVADKNLDTSWRGHRIYWHNHRHEQLILDLKQNEEIGALIWVNWNHTLTPTDYTIDVSTDGENWTTVKKVSGGKERVDGEQVIDKFSSQSARFVRMDFTGTLGNDAPALKEVEVVNAKYSNLDIAKVFDFTNNPFNHFSNIEEARILLPQIASFINLSVRWTTDKGEFNKDLPLNKLDSAHTYSMILNQGGTKIEKLEIISPAPFLIIHYNEASIANFSLTGLKEKNQIKTFSTN
ncbi:MAG: discoidin domain-containing protein [Candidatus Daviesbacteria bacterium]|nr:discoidin domain-containing protein [Candidatus Daviesbacteria bacterium]